jgi:hypothetical protein
LPRDHRCRGASSDTSEKPADQNKHSRFEKELQKDINATCAYRHPYPDFARTLGH